jgi:diguanylate cyclase (GGDEF)-like protein
VARRIRRVIREADSVARVGGDEFGILLVDVSSREVERVADRVLACFDEPFLDGSAAVPLSASLGWTIGTGNVDRADDLVEDAHLAMETVKATGKGRAERYEARMRDEAVRTLGPRAESAPPPAPGAVASDAG